MVRRWKKGKGTIHWVSAKHSINAKVKVYDKLFNKMNPYDGDKNDFIKHLNQNSLKLINNVKLESSMINSLKSEYINLLEFLKWIKINKDNLVFNQIVNLKIVGKNIRNKILFKN